MFGQRRPMGGLSGMMQPVADFNIGVPGGFNANPRGGNVFSHARNEIKQMLDAIRQNPEMAPAYIEAAKQRYGVDLRNISAGIRR